MTPSAEISVTAWRDYEPEACLLEGMSLGEATIAQPSGAAAESLWRLGARRVRINHLVDLATPAAADFAALGLIRDLTSHAVFVEWRLHLPDADASWRLFSHLHPPVSIDGSPGSTVLSQWRRDHYLGKLAWLRGPGFIQIRDRRWGDLRLFTLDQPGELAAVVALSEATAPSLTARAAVKELGRHHLALQIGKQLWFAPYSYRRRPQHAW
ncbi:DUF5825 family protein [Streptomyces sp. NPDC086023]|uniref:DUF5825 family protein n=1 Tax=Streptomyces sp. NPDC086023 TaxID=3365746 RepID=UPI0037CE0C13